MSQQRVTVHELTEDPELAVALHVAAGLHGLERIIDHTRIQKSGLALVGHFHGIVPTRVQILGETELSYLEGLDAKSIPGALEGLFSLKLSCVVITAADRLGADIRRQFELCANQTDTPLLVSTARSSVTIKALHERLDELLAPRCRLHGVLLDVFGIGMLIRGPSGVGKSEAALDLIMRGHRLVADDAVACHARPPGVVVGGSIGPLRHHLEVRGLGILNIKDLFGVSATREQKHIDLLCALSPESEDLDDDRLGIDDHTQEILGIALPSLSIVVRPGRDMASILEVAARNQLLRLGGRNSARELMERIDRAAENHAGGVA